MQGEGAVIGKAVECPAAGSGQCAGEQPVGSLIQERSGLLAFPRGGKIVNRAFPNPDFVGHLSIRWERFLRQTLSTAHRNIIPLQDALGMEYPYQRLDEVSAQ